jgi:hypothetical protein
MTDNNKLTAACGAIMEASAEQLGELAIPFLARLGELGREGRLALVGKIETDRDSDVDEGLAQLEDVIAATN